MKKGGGVIMYPCKSHVIHKTNETLLFANKLKTGCGISKGVRLRM